MQQDNNPKHTSHSIKEWLKKNKVNVLEWLSQSPDLNPIKLVEGPKQAVHRRKPTNITEFKWFCTKEWAKTPTSYCAGLISIYKKLYLQLLQQKGVTPDTESKDSHTFATHRYVTMDHFFQIINDKENIFLSLV